MSQHIACCLVFHAKSHHVIAASLVTPLCPGAEGPVEGSERHHHGGEVQSRGEARDHRRGVAQDIPHPRQVSTYGDG